MVLPSLVNIISHYIAGKKVTAAVVARNFTAVRIRREVFPDYV
jgi:hypothetical protein